MDIGTAVHFWSHVVVVVVVVVVIIIIIIIIILGRKGDNNKQKSNKSIGTILFNIQPIQIGLIGFTIAMVDQT